MTLNGFVATPPGSVIADNPVVDTFVPTNNHVIHNETTDTAGSLRESVRQCVKQYMSKLDGQEPKELWKMVCEEVEVPLIRTILEYTNFNQSKAAIWLGISRGTLRKKMAEYNIDKID